MAGRVSTQYLIEEKARVLPTLNVIASGPTQRRLHCVSVSQGGDSHRASACLPYGAGRSVDPPRISGSTNHDVIRAGLVFGVVLVHHVKADGLVTTLFSHPGHGRGAIWYRGVAFLLARLSGIASFDAPDGGGKHFEMPSSIFFLFFKFKC